MMRFVALLPLALCAFAATPVHADPYRWCATYAGYGGGGVESCYYLTLEQCRASVSGIGGFCRLNGFYDGLPVSTGSPATQPKRRKHS
jgi:hypothetical protein